MFKQKYQWSKKFNSITGIFYIQAQRHYFNILKLFGLLVHLKQRILLFFYCGNQRTIHNYIHNPYSNNLNNQDANTNIIIVYHFKCSCNNITINIIVLISNKKRILFVIIIYVLIIN